MTKTLDALPNPLRLIPLADFPEVEPGADLPGLVRNAATRAGIDLAGMVLVVCQKIISKAEGRLVSLSEVAPSAEAREIAGAHGRDPRQVEVVLRESRRIVRRGNGVLITETHHGFVCANAGVDLSNAPGPEVAILLPEDPDASARRLFEALSSERGTTPIVISDTFGRPWREGLVDVALGSAGLAPIRDDRGSRDRAGRELLVTQPATADQLAAAAGLLMWKSAGIPVVAIEGLLIEGDGTVREALLREASTDLFR
ncbi:MAG: coenzyme F420-0:L-glutamate ligase [Myxococcales bacterium]|nr:coenzyme F420-0:L-glutamate ligase [Myxococcales bacterium]HIK84849.1 coenzyme F420-0:L-glutamate ligase [Myxococcales bacterium]